MISVSDQPGADWDGFVAGHPEASLYHQSAWSLLVHEVFGHAACFLEARDEFGRLTGVLPLVRQKSLLLGSFATSVPFFNYGGALALSPDVASALMQRAVQQGRDWGCSFVEFRDCHPRAGDWLVRTDKASLVLQLPASFEDLSKKLGAKLRSQARRTDREGATVRCGGIELLDAFYDVFCRNMRDLGTPTYPRRFFEAILQRFPAQCLVLCVYRSNQPAAAGFLLFNGGKAEIPWASCREDAKPLGFNMKLYWEVLSAVVARGCSSFDFGRSTVDSGTYRFKMQWGAKPMQLYWHRWESAGSARSEAAPSDGRLRQLAGRAWKKLPLAVANFAGPLISPSLPW
jgi:FemAB-related protein (PEP-CTERM system-associated)